MNISDLTYVLFLNSRDNKHTYEGITLFCAHLHPGLLWLWDAHFTDLLSNKKEKLCTWNRAVASTSPRQRFAVLFLHDVRHVWTGSNLGIRWRFCSCEILLPARDSTSSPTSVPLIPRFYSPLSSVYSMTQKWHLKETWMINVCVKLQIN